MKKIFYIYLIFIMLLLCSCFENGPDFAFIEGTFEYDGEPVEYYDNIIIEDIIIILNKTDEESDLNCIKDKVTNVFYDIDFMIKINTKEDYIYCSFKYDEKREYRKERYGITLDFSELYYEGVEQKAAISIPLDLNAEKTELKYIFLTLQDLYYEDKYFNDYQNERIRFLLYFKEN